MSLNAAERLFSAAHALVPGEGVTEGDRLSIQSGWATAVLGIAVAIVLFVLAEKRYGARLREEQKERAQQHEDSRRRRARAAERASWQREFEEIRSYHLRVERVADRVIAAPGRDRPAADENELKDLEIAFEAVSRRCPDDLVTDLRQVAEAIRRLRRSRLSDDATVQEAYRRALSPGGSGAVARASTARAIGAHAVAQHEAALSLRKELDDVWRVLRTARGEE